MVELREIDTARAILRQTAVFARMKLDEPERFLRLEHLCGRTYFDIRCVLASICSENVLFHVKCVKIYTCSAVMRQPCLSMFDSDGQYGPISVHLEFDLVMPH